MTKLRNHPNVLRLHAVAFAGEKNAETDGFFLMDLCTSTLNDRLLAVQYAMEEDEIVEVFAAIISAVHHMHSLATPICHRYRGTVGRQQRGSVGRHQTCRSSNFVLQSRRRTSTV